jgi:hypothetical protein
LYNYHVSSWEIALVGNDEAKSTFSLIQLKDTASLLAESDNSEALIG